ncbi:hypothetical protein [Kitasatospora indigofera]|uniref:hypothetical protein n=1 Tax=Kitasatospora indigofera TaxID=67307 RepID=UPI003690FA37
MPSIKRLAGVGVATIALLASGVVAATSASAAPTYCANYDGGTLCAAKYSNGYNVWFDNDSGWKQLDFNLGCDLPSGSWIRFKDQGSFWSAPGATNSYFFSLNSAQYPSCWPILKDVQTGISYSWGRH